MTTPPRTGDDRSDPRLSELISERRHLTNLAYRLLGSLADAEDVVQETYARWYAIPREQQAGIKSPGAFGLVIYGRANAVGAWLVLAGLVTVEGPRDMPALVGHAVLWDPLFAAWGVLLALGLDGSATTTPLPRRLLE